MHRFDARCLVGGLLVGHVGRGGRGAGPVHVRANLVDLGARAVGRSRDRRDARKHLGETCAGRTGHRRLSIGRVDQGRRGAEGRVGRRRQTRVLLGG